MNTESKQTMTPLEKYEQAAFELALYEIAMDEAQKMSEDTVDEQQIEEYCQASFPKMIALIRKHTRCSRLAFLKDALPKAGIAAALLIIVTALGGAIAIASSDTIRAHVIQFLIRITPQYYSVGYYPTGKTIQIPEGWTENYYLTYIPEGFEVVECRAGNTICEVLYCMDNHTVRFSIGATNSLSNIDSEDGIVDTIMINGHATTHITEGHWRTCIGQLGDKYYLLATTLPEEELLKMAESISLIRK